MPGDAHSINEIDASCRAPLRLTVACGALWLLLGAALNALCAIKLIAPGFLATSPFWTYGRVQAAGTTALLYGFALPVAFGLCAWVLSRSGSVRLAGAGMVTIAGTFWNIGVSIGVFGIFCGDATGFDSFELPRCATPILFASYLLFAGCVVLTVHRRRSGALTIPQWFAITAIAWFGWTELTGDIFLLFNPARGIVAPLIASWHARNLEVVVLGFSCLALAFYFLPKLLNQPIGSRPLALFGLWTLALSGGFGGQITPVPAWAASVNTAMGVLSFAAVLALSVSFWLTIRRHLNALDANPTLRFTYIGVAFWIVASAQGVLAALPSVSQLVQFTFFEPARFGAFLFGFVVMVVVGAIEFVLPRVAGGNLPSPRLRAAQFWCMLAGAGLTYFSRLVAGVAQGILLSDPSNSFPVVMRTLSPPLQTVALGEILVLVGVLCFAANVLRMIASPKKEAVAPEPDDHSSVPSNSAGLDRLAGGGLALTLMISWVALVVGPIIQLGGLQQATTIGSDARLYPTPRPGMAARGERLFRENGCNACHTQQIRPAASGFDIVRGWGKRRSVARDYIFDQPAMPGSIRIGPDLANVGARQNVDTFLIRLYNPTAVTRSSIMPSYRFLFEPPGKNGNRELVPRPEAHALAAYLQSLRSDAPLYEVPPRTAASPRGGIR